MLLLFHKKKDRPGMPPQEKPLPPKPRPKQPAGAKSMPARTPL
jgi:hypothetical protein